MPAKEHGRSKLGLRYSGPAVSSSAALRNVQGLSTTVVLRAPLPVSQFHEPGVLTTALFEARFVQFKRSQSSDIGYRPSSVTIISINASLFHLSQTARSLIPNAQSPTNRKLPKPSLNQTQSMQFTLISPQQHYCPYMTNAKPANMPENTTARP